MSQEGRDKQIFDLLASQPILLGKSQASERHYLKKKKKQDRMRKQGEVNDN